MGAKALIWTADTEEAVPWVRSMTTASPKALSPVPSELMKDPRTSRLTRFTSRPP